MKNLVKIVAAAFIWLSASLMLQGQVVPTISVQGTLKDANGSSVSDGVYTVTFRLFNQETGGNPVWQEEATVEVVGGIYSHYLGSITPLNGANFANTLYMGLKVGNYELTPRTLMTYAPYTFSSNVAQKVVCSGAVGDIKYSILNPTQFAAVNGDCWVPMDGRALASNSQLRQITGRTSLPDVGGVFIRSQEFPSSPNRDPSRTHTTQVGIVQDQAFQSHAHGVTDPGHRHLAGGYAGGSLGGSLPIANAQITQLEHLTSIETTGISIENNGGAETRPVNMNFWTYIRIN